MDNWIEYEHLRKTPHTVKDLEIFRDKESKLFLNDKKRKFLEEIEHSDEELDPKEEAMH